MILKNWKMKTKLFASLLTAAFTLQTIYSFADNVGVSPEKGKTIFTSRCTSCHNVNAQVVGPALANVDQRRSVDWIVNFVHSPKTLIQKKDEQAVALYNQFNQIIMPDHSDLSSDDIKNVLAYIKSETKSITATQAPFVKPGTFAPNYYPLSITKNAWFFVTYIFAVFVLVALLIAAVNIKDMQRHQRNL
jgi:cytochrome c551/c552